jgi:broad specificity phosphatase PhoE
VSLIFVRHGHAAGTSGRCIGHTDVALSALGRAEIERLADGPLAMPVALHASDLARASSSAATLGARWGLVPRLDARLRELSFGEWEGRTWDDIHVGDAARLDAWAGDWIGMRPPGGESFTDLVDRVAAWIDDVRPSAAAGDVVAVAHAGSIRAALCVAGVVPAARALEVRIDYAQVVRVDLNTTRSGVR